MLSTQEFEDLKNKVAFLEDCIKKMAEGSLLIIEGSEEEIARLDKANGRADEAFQRLEDAIDEEREERI